MDACVIAINGDFRGRDFWGHDNRGPMMERHLADSHVSARAFLIMSGGARHVMLGFPCDLTSSLCTCSMCLVCVVDETRCHNKCM